MDDWVYFMLIFLIICFGAASFSYGYTHHHGWDINSTLEDEFYCVYEEGDYLRIINVGESILDGKPCVNGTITSIPTVVIFDD